MRQRPKTEEEIPEWLLREREELPPIEDTRKLYEVIHDNIGTSRHIQNRLAHLARAFATTGNDTVANELFDIGDAVARIAEDARRMHGREQFHQTEQSRHMLGQTLLAAVTVIDRDLRSATRISELENQLPKEDA